MRELGVRTNADTPKDAEVARAFGAEGIGLCRTEHMFFDPRSRILAMRLMILADDERERRALGEALARSSARTSPGSSARWGPAGHHPPARSAAPRVFARRAQATGGARQGHADVVERVRSADRVPARAEPDARAPRVPARDHPPRDHRDASAGHPRGGLHREGGGRRRSPRGDGAARRHRERARAPEEDRAERGGEGLRREAGRACRSWSAR
jgi:hypothetical protein